MPNASPNPVSDSSFGNDTEGFAPVAASAQPILNRRMALALIIVGLCTGAIVGWYYSGITYVAAAPPVGPAKLLNLVMPRVREPEVLFSASNARPTATPDLLPAGIPAIYAFYSLPGPAASETPRVTWSRDGKGLSTVPASGVRPDGGAVRSGGVTLVAPGGKLQPGIYEVQLAFREDKYAASFVVAWGAEAVVAQAAPEEAEAVISELVLTDRVTEGGEVRARGRFDGHERIYAVFRYTGAEPGTAVLVRWYGGQEPIPAATREIILPATAGRAHAWLQAAPPSALPPGSYRATVTMQADDKPLANADFTVTAESASP